MIKIDYPADKGERIKFENEYYSLFKIRETDYNGIINTKGLSIIDKKRVESFINCFSFRKILTGDIKSLILVLKGYQKLPENVQKRLNNIFEYDQPKISAFFRKFDYLINLKSCHYCNLDSVHVYLDSDSNLIHLILSQYDDPLDFIRRSTVEELQTVLNIDKKKATDIANIVSKEKLEYKEFTEDAKILYYNIKDINWIGYNDVLDFINHAPEDELKKIYNIGGRRSENIINQRMHYWGNLYQYKDALDAYYKCCDVFRTRDHFTLDHFVPQAKCGALAISLYNFIPSCYVCNTKLKKEELLCKEIDNLYKYSPSYSDYAKSGNIEFKLIQKPETGSIIEYGRQKSSSFLNSFYLDIETEDVDNLSSKTFQLQQRYSIHKEKAVKLAYKKELYSPQRIKEIAKTLASQGISEEQIKKDIFDNTIHENESLSKLHKDIMKQLGILNSSE